MERTLSGVDAFRAAERKRTVKASGTRPYRAIGTKRSNEGGHGKKILTMDTYGLFEGSDRDSTNKTEKLFGGEPKELPTKTPKPACRGILRM